MEWKQNTNTLTIHDTGILYAATGARHRAEAIASASRCKSLMPTIPIAIWTDSELSHPSFDLIFVTPTPYYDYMDKVTGIPQTPFNHTLFLDTDTYVCTDVSALFGLLDRFEIVAAHASNRESTRSTYLISGVPAAFPEMNTGVLLYRSSQRITALFADWYQLFELDRLCFKEKAAKDPCASLHDRLKPPGDQSSFRHALFRSDLRIATLPPEYNFRFAYSAFAGSEVKILHGRYRDLAWLASVVNSEAKHRVYVPGHGLLRPSPNEAPADGL